MTATDLQEIADTVVRRAQRDGYVVPRDVREELVNAGVDTSRWKEVLDLARPFLTCSRGRYYHGSASSTRVRQEQDHQRAIHETIRELIRERQAESNQVERREEDRVDFIQPVEIKTEDGRQSTFLSRDLSTTGIRLIGPRSLLGHKIQIKIPRGDQTKPCSFLVRILWTGAVGDGLFENGGMFLEALGHEQ